MSVFNRTLLKKRVQTLFPFLLAGFLLVLLVGPGILLVYPLQRWASRQIWDAGDRWETIWCFAIFGWCSYVPLILLRVQFAFVWQQVAFLGTATFASLRFRSFLMLFLIPTATLLLERVSPRTNSALIRVKHPGDVMQQQSASTASPASARAVTVKREKKAFSQPKAPHFLSLTVHRPGGKGGYKRDPRPPGEVLYEEKQHRLAQAKPASVLPVPSVQSVPKKINWDEGEGTYSEK